VSAAGEQQATGEGVELLRLLERLERRPEALTRAEVRELPRLYRRTVTELADRRARGVAADRLAGIERLMVRAHGLLYAPPPIALGAAFARLVRSLPSRVRAARRMIALATALLSLGAIWGYLEVRRDPAGAAVLLSPELLENAESFRTGAPMRPGDPIYGAFYFTNNARVAFNAWALGATFGIGTALLLLYNGVILGATVAVVAAGPGSRTFLSFVLPHSGVELAAILIAAAGGFAMASGLLRPGPRRRRDAFRQSALDSLPLALGAAVLLSIAGLTEGWFSPLPLPLGLKALLGGSLTTLLAIYLLAPNRNERDRTQ
jgi:uncharacterized membrane protein SpoIIM required for sporulation